MGRHLGGRAPFVAWYRCTSGRRDWRLEDANRPGLGTIVHPARAAIALGFGRLDPLNSPLVGVSQVCVDLDRVVFGLPAIIPEEQGA